MANLTNYPTIRPSLLLDFANSGRVDPRIEFTRATTATRINAKGLVEVVPANVPRIDYNPATGECLGLLIEDSRTNDIIQSEFGDGFVDSYSGGAVSISEFSGFSGGVSVQKSASEGSWIYKIPGSTVGERYTFSVFVLMDDGGEPVVSPSGTSGDFAMVFSSDSTEAPKITRLFGGVYRVQVNQVATKTDGFYGVVKYPEQSSRGFKITGYDRQAGTRPTSYIPTTTAAVTRVADIARMAGSNFSDWFNPLEGTMFAEYTSDNEFAYIFNIRDGSGLEDRALIYAGGGYAAPANILSLALAGKRAIAYRNKDFAMSTNAEPLLVSGADGLDLLDSAMAIIGTGTIFGGLSTLNGHIRRIAYYPIRLANEQLQRLTA